MVDKNPEAKLAELKKTYMAMSEEEITKEEMEAIRQGEIEIANGEYCSLDCKLITFIF